MPDATGHFGQFGGRLAPEALMSALDELTAAYESAKADPALRGRARPGCCATTPAGRRLLTEARRFAAEAGGCRVFLKREDLTHTGSHKINNVLGQALLTRRMGKTRIIAETGAGQHGVATATAAALLGLECVVYMGEEDTRGRRSTWPGCGCSAPRSCRSRSAAGRSRTRSTRRSATGSRPWRPRTTASAR